MAPRVTPVLYALSLSGVGRRAWIHIVGRNWSAWLERRRGGKGLAAPYDVFEEEGSVRGRLFQDMG